MAEDTLRRNLSVAFDPGPGFPSRTLVSRTVAGLRSRPAVRRGGAPTHRYQWLLPLVAVLLVVVTVATLLLAGRLLHNARPVPIQHPGPGGLSCSTSTVGPFPSLAGGSLEPGPLPPAPTVMATATVGWAGGGLRTTDGGLHWTNALPRAIFSGEDKVSLSNGQYPPSFADFYLDGTHAWAFRTYSSDARCEDHFMVFQTSDGGRTWQQSAPMTIEVLPSGDGISGAGNPKLYNPSIQISFANPESGWVWIPFGPPSHAFGGGFEALEGFLYGTSDGGLHWHLISTLDSRALGIAPPACKSAVNSLGSLGTMRFRDQDTGWMSVTCKSQQVLITHDGGRSWALQELPVPALVPPQYFDQRSGLLDTDSGIYSTSDAGKTWQGPFAPLPTPADGPSAVYFASPTDMWAVESAYYSNVSWVYHSMDEGRTWTQVSGDLAVNQAIAVSFSDSSHGMMLGLVFNPPLQQKGTSPAGGPYVPSYVLLTTADGGRTWRTIVPQVGLPS